MWKTNYFKMTMKTCTIFFTIALLIILIWGIKDGIFSSNDKFLLTMKHLGVIAPFAFLILQIVQVIFPVIPGGASCLVGVLAFGPVEGFIYNYIGLCIGSVIAFFISKKYGMCIVRKLFKPNTVDKYQKAIENRKFDKIFFLGILLPGAPDDLLCYMAGLTNMNLKKFTTIILVGKPLTLVFYSLAMVYLPNFF